MSWIDNTGKRGSTKSMELEVGDFAGDTVLALTVNETMIRLHSSSTTTGWKTPIASGREVALEFASTEEELCLIDSLRCGCPEAAAVDSGYCREPADGLIGDPRRAVTVIQEWYDGYYELRLS